VPDLYQPWLTGWQLCFTFSGTAKAQAHSTTPLADSGRLRGGAVAVKARTGADRVAAWP